MFNIGKSTPKITLTFDLWRRTVTVQDGESEDLHVHNDVCVCVCVCVCPRGLRSVGMSPLSRAVISAYHSDRAARGKKDTP